MLQGFMLPCPALGLPRPWPASVAAMKSVEEQKYFPTELFGGCVQAVPPQNTVRGYTTQTPEHSEKLLKLS